MRLRGSIKEVIKIFLEGVFVHTAIEATIVSLLTKVIDSIFLAAIISIVTVEIGHTVYRIRKDKVK